MNKKFTLTLIIAIALISVIAFSACGLTAVAEGVGDVWASSGDYPYPNDDTVSPGYSGYTAADQIVLKDGETLTPITADMDAWTAYQTMRENQSKVSAYAQVNNTLSQIEIQLEKRLYGVVKPGTNTFGNPITQYASYMVAYDGQGNKYTQTVSQMDKLLPALDAFGIQENFGVWTKSATVDGVNYYQEGNPGTRTFDAEYPAGVTAQWKGDPEITEGTGVTYDRSKFDVTKRITKEEDTETDTYKVFWNDDEELGNYRDSKKNEKNASNWDEVGNRVIKVQFKGSDGSWGGDTWYVWDDQDGNTDGSYVGFDYDRWYTALPNRGDGISNYLVNDETFDKVNSKITKETVDGHTLYVIDVKLQATDAYSWDLITSGEFGALQGGIVDFIGFSKVDSLFSDELTVRYEVWDTGVIRRAFKQYSVESAEGAANDENKMISVLQGSSYAWGHATNNQIIEYAYSGDALDVSDSSMYTFGAGALDKWTALGIGVGVGAAVIIVLIVTLVVLAKKGIIGKKKNKAAAAEGEAEDAVDSSDVGSKE